jgi:hypothetical protein
MSEEKSSPIGIIAIVFVAAVFVGCESNNYPETANKNEQSATKPTEPEKPKAPVFDPNRGGHRDIEAGIRGSLQQTSGEITAEDMGKLRNLKVINASITDLSPLKAAINMEELTLHDNAISDLSSLSSMKNLRRLSLYRNRISDLSPLAGLTNLRHIELDINQITDLSPLAGLKQLTYLGLDNNPKLTRAEIDKLQKALPNCEITHDAKN